MNEKVTLNLIFVAKEKVLMMNDNKLLSHHRRAFYEVKLEMDYIEKMLCGKEFNHDLRIMFKSF